MDRVLSEWEQLLEEAHTDLVNECGTLFDERRALISGTSPSGSTGEPVPGFWLGAMLKSQAMRSVVQQSDKQALEYLEDVRVAPIDTEARLAARA